MVFMMFFKFHEQIHHQIPLRTTKPENIAGALNRRPTSKKKAAANNVFKTLPSAASLVQLMTYYFPSLLRK